jgi:chemotaxis protein methyltransferase CheR
MIFEAPLEAPQLQQLLELVYKHTGVRMTREKKELLQGRLRSRVVARQLSSWQHYIGCLDSDSSELQKFVDRVTTHETYFHRTAHVWDYFSDVFLPAWYAHHRDQLLQLWSAAASTGEEAYTMAMYCEAFAKQHKDFHYRITGTDVSEETVLRARAGIYQERALSRLLSAKPDFIEDYMVSCDAEGNALAAVGAHQPPVPTDAISAHRQFMTPSSELRRHVTFLPHNLLTAAQGFGPFSIVFLRNVLIYFDAADQERVIRHVSRMMSNKGVLILGESESLGQVKVPFAFVQPQIYVVSGAA